MSEATLQAKAEALIGEDVLGAGVFRTLGSWVGGDVGGVGAAEVANIGLHNPLLDAAAGIAGATAGMAAGAGATGDSMVELVAVTPTRVIAIADTLGKLGEVKHEWKRDAIDVHVSHLVSKVFLTITDHSDGTQHQFEAGAFGASHASVVVHLLTSAST